VGSLEPRDLPVAIVGGGPVGSALALYLNRYGVPVVLIDAGASQRKICGEGILPVGWEVIEDLGLESRLPQRASIEALLYTMEDQGGLRTMKASLSRRGFGVARDHLFTAFRSALESSGVELLANSRLRDFEQNRAHVTARVEAPGGGLKSVPCRLLVGADGLQSLVRRKAGLQSPVSRRYMRWGARCYFRASERRQAVEVTLGRGVESYLTPLGEGLYGLAFLWSPQELGRPLPGSGSLYERLLAFFSPAMIERLPQGRGELMGDGRAIGPLQQLVVSPLHPSGRVALVGDAAGYFDALTGEGLCLGLRQARVLASCIAQGTIWDYPDHHRSIKRRHQLVVGGLLWLIHQPALRDRVFLALAQSPRQFQAVIRFAVEEARWSTLVSRDFPRFLLCLLTGR